MATDLTARALPAVNGERIVDIAATTLSAGGSMVETWTRLEPLVRTLTDRVAASLEDELPPKESAALLSLCANVVAKVGSASTGMLKASEGLSKLSLLLSVGKVRKDPGQLTEKQLAAVVLETAKRIVDRTGKCPLCQPIVVEPTPDAAA